MKALAPLLAALLLASAVRAQDVRPFDTDHCGKLAEVIAEYRKTHPAPDAQDRREPGEEGDEEGAEYLFGRAVWYWQRHLDEDGYMVSDRKRWDEWQRFAGQSAANKGAKTTGNRAAWTFQGPDKNGATGYSNDVGRTNHLSFHPTDSNTFWVGTPYAGAWKTTNNGATWMCMTDGAAITGVSEIVINRLRPATVYLAGPLGVLKSGDGGATWATTGFSYLASDYKSIGTMVMSAADTGVLLISARDGIYRTANAGATWTKVLPLLCYRLLCHPQNPKLLFAASYGSGSGFSFNSGQIFRSSDNGLTWTQVSSFTNASAIELAVTPASPKVVKAVSTNMAGGLDGVFTSSDTGQSFRQIFFNSGTGCSHNFLGYDTLQCGGQGGYNLAIAISPTDTTRVYIGGIMASVSTDGGNHWKLFNTSAAPGANNFVFHPDIHYIGFSPLRPSRLYVCSDGGIAKTETAATGVWTDITTGLGISQLYSVDVSGRANYQLGGFQDCGSKVVRGYSGAVSPVDGADGTTIRMDWGDSATFYTGAQNGGFLNRVKSAGGTYTRTDIRNGIPGAGTGTSNWITPLLVHPVHHDTLVTSYNGIALSPDRGDHWTSITYNLPNAANVTLLAMTPADGNTIYAAPSNVSVNGISIYCTFNLGRTWAPIASPYNKFPSDIKADPKDKTHFWVSFSGYGGTKLAEYKPGTGWKDLTANLPDVPVSCMAIDTFSGELYAGTDVAVFLYNSTTAQWDLYNKNLPIVMTNALAIDYRRNEIWAATWGRSLWKSPKNTANPTGVNGSWARLPAAVSVFPNPGQGRFTLDGGAAFTGHEASVRLIDLTGRPVWSGSRRFDDSGKTTLDLSHTAKGSYELEISRPGNPVAAVRLSIE